MRVEEHNRAAEPTRILIVDDNVELAENIAEILQIDGFATEVANSAEEAIPAALGRTVRVIVTDYRLPGMSGAELVKLIREHRSDVTAVVISAYTDDRTITDAHEAGAEFLPKPVDFSQLASFVRARA